MRYFRDWPIRYKLILPLLAVMVFGGAGIGATFVGIYSEIVADVLPEERALDGIRRASLELLGEYRKYMIVQGEATRREIDELKEEVELYEAAFEQTARDKAEAPFVAAIEVAEQKLKQLGDEAVALRLRLADQIETLELFERDVEDLPAHLPGGADVGDAATGAEPMEPGGVHELHELVHGYLSELREYTPTPGDQTRREIAEIERSLERISRAITDDPALEPANQARNAAVSMLIQRLLESGRITVALTNDFLAKLEALEENEDELLGVLEKAGAVVAGETDTAFQTGFAAVATVIIAVVALVVLVGYFVSRGIAGPVTILAATADRLGAGDLSVRADVRSTDEIGGLATAFNQMAGSLESNVKLREQAETDLKALNDELEQRVNDRTAELRAAQQELLRRERLAALGQLTATVSHELRNPLGTIRTSLFTVDECTRDKGLGVERAMGRIERNIARCDEIIGELLDFTRIRELERETTQIDGWLEDTLDEHQLPEGIVLERALDAGVPLAIDGERLRRVLINLLDNACHAMAEANGAGGTVTVSSRVSDGRLEVSVADSGPGIPADVLPKVFEPLYSTKSFGVGLGLPMVKQILEQHGGGVEIANQEIGGARVLLWLALDQGERGAEA